MRFFYTLIFRMAVPFILLRLLWRSRRLPAYGNRWQERFAWFKPQVTPGGLWVHAVSFGESIAAIPIIQAFHGQFPDAGITVTNMTPTGSEKIRATFGKEVFNVYVPYDLPGVLRRFIRKVKPSLVVIIETELWPNMLHELKKQNIPVLLANGRLSARSARNYHRIKSLARSILNCFTQLLVQTEIEAERYKALGCDPAKISVTGSIKFDLTITPEIFDKAKLLRQQLGDSRSIFIAASTHDGEEILILQAYEAAKLQVPDLLLLLVPRHPDRFEKVAKLCVERHLNVVRRSEQQACSGQTDIFLGDTMGELLVFYAASDVAFVGGSLVPVGGHNVLEPAALAKPVLIGPHMHNFTHITELLLEAKGIEQVDDSETLTRALVLLMQIPGSRKEMGVNAEKIVRGNRGALAKHTEIIAKLFQQTH